VCACVCVSVHIYMYACVFEFCVYVCECVGN